MRKPMLWYCLLPLLNLTGISAGLAWERGAAGAAGIFIVVSILVMAAIIAKIAATTSIPAPMPSNFIRDRTPAERNRRKLSKRQRSQGNTRRLPGHAPGD